MTGNMLAAFALVAGIAIATPGPTVLLALTNGSRHGMRGATYGILGACLSDVVLIGSVALGLAAAMAASQLWFSLLKWLGVVYLCYLGLSALLSRPRPAGLALTGSPTTGPTPLELFQKSFLVAVTNPKGYLFFTALLPQFIDTAYPPPMQYLQLGGIFTILDLGIMSAYAGLGATAARIGRGGAEIWMQRLCGATFLALGAGLAFYREAPT